VAGNLYQGFRFSRIAADSSQLVFDLEAIAVVFISQHDKQRVGILPTPALSQKEAV